jgi:ABC-type uncharacterized transport system substrate-binding protein
MPVIGVLSAEWPDTFADRLRAFHDGLSETGYVAGRNLGIEYRWAEGRNDRLPELAGELVRHQVMAIVVAGSTPATQAAKTATTTIPILFYIGADPVKVGLVTSLSRPGGNVTGVVTLNVEVGAKRLELLHEMVPSATTVALLINPTNRILSETLLRDAQSAAPTLGLKLHVLYASNEGEFHAAFTRLVQLRAGALVIGSDAFFNSRSEQHKDRQGARPHRSGFAPRPRRRGDRVAVPQPAHLSPVAAGGSGKAVRLGTSTRR